jgi:two-component system, NarL family, nitrate/nitrite response regulator NarL
MDTVKLLVVDSNDIFRRIVERFLRDTGHFELIVTAQCAEAALSAMQASPPQVIVLDVDPADASSLAKLARLRTAAPAVKIIALTLWEAEAYRQAALNAGADGLVDKGAIHAQLLPAIERLLPVAE